MGYDLMMGLTVGINNFQNYPESKLAGCVPDARTMTKVFTGLGCRVIELHDAQATDYGILNRIQEFLAEAVRAKSYYLGLWFSSHGTHYPEPREADGLGEALCCYNLTEQDDEWSSGFIKDVTMRNLLNRFPKTGIVEVGFDTCYSGGMDRLMWSKEKNRFMHNPGNKVAALRLANTTMTAGLNSNVVMWQACSEAQTSADAYIDGGAHGAFTYYFDKAIKNHAGGSRVEILLAARAGLSQGGYSQFPRLKCWNAAAQREFGK